MTKENIVVIISLLAIFGLWYYQQNQEKEKVIMSLNTDQNKTGRPRVLEFYTDRCGACRRFAPTFKKVEERFVNEVDFYRCDANDGRFSKYINAFDIQAVPTIVLLDKQGKRWKQFQGGRSEEEFTTLVNTLKNAQ